MIAITTRLTASRAADAQLVLPFELRKRSRMRATLSNGDDVGLFLERGTVLRDGDLLQADDGRVVQIVAAAETVSTVSSADAQALLRASYHLGNRHVSLQIGQGWLRYLHDHVLDEMVRGLGLAVKVEQAPFEPEAGAYGGGHHGHDHSHDHEQEHEHAHGTDHRHRHDHG